MIRIFTTSAALLFVAGSVAWAQPATDAPKAVNPANVGRGPQTPEQKAAADQQMQEAIRKGQEQFAAMMKLTPEQQKEAMRKLKEQILRGTFTRAGFTDQKLQDRLIAFVAEQELSRQKVRVAANRVYLGLEPQGVPTDKQGMTVLLVAYLDAVEDAKDEREAATKTLDKEINFTSNPHLMALLTLNGLIGEASWFTGDVTMLGTMSIGSLAELNTAPAAR